MLEAIFKRWPLKLLALCIAFAIWLAITGENQIVQDFNVPLTMELSEETILTGSRPTQISVRLRGPESVIRRIDAFDLAAEVDLTNTGPGEHSVDIHPTDIGGVPVGVLVEMVDPNRIDLQVAPRLRRLLPVVPDLIGQPAEGFFFYGAQADPETLEVTGPQAEVGKLDRIKTAPIRLDGRSASFTATVTAIPDSPEIRIVRPRPLSVRVEIDEVPVEVTFPEVPVILAGAVWETTVDPAFTTVTLSGPPPLLETIEPSQLRCVVDVSGLGPAEEPYRVPARLEFQDIPARDLSRIREKSPGLREVTIRVFDRRITP
jgi:YbbR domain-containing protein